MQKVPSLLALQIRRSLRIPIFHKIDIRRKSHNIPQRMTESAMADFVDKAEELAVSRDLGEGGGRGRSGGRGGRGSKRGGRGSGAKGEMNREVTVSKALSRLLRHAAVEAGLKLDAEGFATVEQVVSLTHSHRLSTNKRISSVEIFNNSRSMYNHITWHLLP